MGTTASGYPYPEDTDLLAQGAQAIKALANAAEPRAGQSAAGTAQVTINGQSIASAAVTFPVGRFTAAPNVTAAAVGGAGAWTSGMVSGITATGCVVWVRNFSGSAGGSTPLPCCWVARS
jgi:hypothetical protein